MVVNSKTTVLDMSKRSVFDSLKIEVDYALGTHFIFTVLTLCVKVVTF